MVNPIKTVDNNSNIPCPSVFEWRLEDVSAADAGRTEDLKMHKKRQGQVVAINLAWNNIKTTDASTILTAFNPEYISVEYLDPKEGGYITSNFYVGDRSAPLYHAEIGRWSNVSFNIIQRDGK